ncbi:MBL fold metallo-hydrolase RNA specificity domain-containing protein [Pectinatus cerevisiiphilus]|uniref:Metallo-beta-lactamase family protein n=1 Tax=Pectinatus cerevisiiphilus TaxID=86956 RepID=A0A4V2US14_9FIRM|nr:MBL fold metallo-hydrolase [Pectinatus cerevisiiphilus]TCS79662.1 metallo-beta-lactamase family protein [Pectinatus cerevisiiphilus]
MNLQFFGAAHTVTGSCYLLEVNNKNIMIDCGMFQGGRQLRDLNYKPFSFAPKQIDAVLLTHAHVDHCGLIPKLCKDGFSGSIYATKATCDLVGIMLPDSAHIQESDAEITNRKGLRTGRIPVAPLYTVEDAQKSLTQFVPLQYGDRIDLTPEVSAVFRDAGHILGSSIIEVYVHETGKKPVKIVFSGDIGQPDQPIVKDPEFISDADCLVIESTYGDRVHQIYDKETALAEIINDTMDRGGNLIIPAFAVGRTQTLLYYLYRLWKTHRIDDIPIILDSPLAIAATRIFAENMKIFDEESMAILQENGRLPAMPQIKICRTAEESKALNSSEGSAIILSASGMCDAGRILHHLKHNLWRPESTVLFVGYQAEGSLGRRLIDGVKRVKILGEEIAVRARIAQLDGFSAHADYKQILDWLGHVNLQGPKQIFLVHGESMAIKSLADKIKETYECNVYAPFYADTAHIDANNCEIVPADIPQVAVEKEMEEFLQLLDADYRQWRKRLLLAVIRDPQIMESAIRQAEKGWRYVKRMFKDFGIN